ncbi:hypothetical protein ACP4OV_016792 [Aristida adscensionis]
MEAADMLGFDLYWHSPPRFAEFYDLDLAAADCVYLPPTASDGDSLSGFCASSRVDSSSPDGANSCYTAAAASPPPPPAAAAVSSKNAVMGRDRRRRIDEKLYALRSVVPNITKMDKASIVRDAIAYIEHLQEQERRMLADAPALQSSAADAETDAAGDLPSRRKKTRRAPDEGATSSSPVQILQVQVSEAGDGLALVMVRCARGRHAVGKVCRALEPLRRRVVTATIAAVGDTVVHTLLLQTEETGSARLKETVQSALAQLDVTRSSFESVCQ